MELEKRFWSKVDKSSDCWLWTGGKDSWGYGTFWIEGKTKGAHRVAYELERGPIMNGLLVCHTCDVSNCVNPEHLFLGTQKDNMVDASNKGRINVGMARGSSNGNARLTEEQVVAILQDTRKQVRTAEDYNVSESTVSKIKKGQIWKHLEDTCRT